MRIGFAVMLAESLAVIVYVADTPRGQHRELILAMAVTSATATASMLFVAQLVFTRPWRAHFSLAWTLLGGVLLAFGAYLDGGLESPLIGLVSLPIVYGAVAFAPITVAGCALAALLELLLIGLTDHHVRVSSDSLLMIFCTAAGVGVLAVAAAWNRSRQDRTEATLNARLAELADTDGLTGCLNHRAFNECVAAEIERASRYRLPLALIVADVDHFKTINDTYGHPVGDDVLRDVGATLRSCLRSADVAGRVGGDEFAILLPHTGPDGALAQAERVQASINPAADVPVTLSIGIASLDPTDATARRLLSDADGALYHMKETGRGGISTG